MKKIFFVLGMILYIANQVSAQRRSLDSADLAGWPTVNIEFADPSGRYFVTSWERISISQQSSSGKVYIISSSDHLWQDTLDATGVSDIAFFADGRQLLYLRNDTLNILSRPERTIIRVPDVKQYQIVSNYLVCTSVNNKSIGLLNTFTGKKTPISSMEKYWLVPGKSELLIAKEGATGGLFSYNLSTGKLRSIYDGVRTEQVLISPDSKLAICLVSLSDHTKQVKRVSLPNGRVTVVVDDHALEEKGYMPLDALTKLTPDAKHLLLSLKPIFQAAKVSSKDVLVRSYLTVNGGKPKAFSRIGSEPSGKLVLGLDDSSLTKLPSNLREFVTLTNQGVLAYNYAEVENLLESGWNYKAITKPVFITFSGKARQLPGEALQISNSGKHILYYEPHQEKLNFYNTGTGLSTSVNLPRGTTFHHYWADQWDTSAAQISDALWLPDDRAVIVHDRYDLWQLDPDGTKAPICLTNGYGREHQISFFRPQLLNSNELIIMAINRTNKDNGFFKVTLNKPQQPELMTMGPYLYEAGFGNGRPVERIGQSERWLVKKESEKEAPNYFVTSDFKHFEPITHNYPEKNYKWYQSELHQWISSLGDTLQGVLYKPENIDPAKRYPVIFYYYEKLSDFLHLYQNPDYSGGTINIPWMVSRGYWVFVTDIRYHIGYTGASVLASIESAAKHIKKINQVDTLHLGIQGHSFGGYETNYIVAHSRQFAAACAASSFSDLISHDAVQQGYSDYLGQGRVGKSLIERPDLYVLNSPIFSVAKVNTPLLMMQNKRDELYPNGIEYYQALRRAGKRVWLLEYEGQAHILGGLAAQDFTRRMDQFFDHYLKGAPAPLWMTRPDENSMTYDTEIRTPGPGLLTPEEQRKMDELLNRKPLTITIP